MMTFKKRVVHLITTRNLFVYLLPIVFLLHQYAGNYSIIPIGSVFLLLAIYLAAITLCAAILYMVFRNWYKAHLFSFLIFGVNFFFGVIQNTLYRLAGDTILPRYSFLFPFLCICLVVAFLFLKRRKSTTGRTGYILSLVLSLLLLGGLTELAINKAKKGNPTLLRDRLSLHPCGDCAKPDIYMILVDSYAGQPELNDIFRFDNGPFLSGLRERGFLVNDSSRSNYNYTLFSMASTLNMSYLLLDKRFHRVIAPALDSIRQNRLARFLQDIGYAYINLSIFQNNDSLKEIKTKFLFNSFTLLNGPTLIDHVCRLVRSFLIEHEGFYHFSEASLSETRLMNEFIYTKTIEQARTQSSVPRFVYTHLIMPHFPYYFDKKGDPFPAKTLLDDYRFSQKNYLEYLQFTNHKLFGLIDEILTHSSRQPIIVLLSDHGFRQFKSSVSKKYYFSNLSAIYLPDKRYANFYTGISNVNLFRVFLNTEFGQQIPLLKDSSTLLLIKGNKIVPSNQ